MNFLQSLNLNDWITLGVFALIACAGIAGRSIWWPAKHKAPTPFQRAICSNAMKEHRADISAMHCAEFTNGFIAGQLSKRN